MRLQVLSLDSIDDLAMDEARDVLQLRAGVNGKQQILLPGWM